ncbi:hypothetical protein GLW08_02540 [Pontibacillus yanchengensis]|uniref:Uncharacterized protein n=2 Tax=Pontibacillus yanchengensis TaxID=462910 RepID=A0ACC7VBT5_9BACI|nr:hypothetical protein [Pontibacillus yanchengensis]MYL34802.1 hypothetical protein [Pontibacillus yanchengensis]MYL52212.1 hypothetical protein [Pontibacillus yanchengensis]
MKDFMYELFQFMKWSEEMKDKYSRLSDKEKEIVNEFAPFSENPETLNTEITKWYEELHKKVTY